MQTKSNKNCSKRKFQLKPKPSNTSKRQVPQVIQMLRSKLMFMKIMTQMMTRIMKSMKIFVFLQMQLIKLEEKPCLSRVNTCFQRNFIDYVRYSALFNIYERINFQIQNFSFVTRYHSKLFWVMKFGKNWLDIGWIMVVSRVFCWLFLFLLIE